MVLRQGHEAELRRLGASAIRLLRIDSMPFAVINRACRLVHRRTVPVAGFRDFESSLKRPSFTFPSLLRVVFIDRFPLSGNDSINATASGAKAARPFIDAFQTSLVGVWSLIRSSTSTEL